ncbi:MAG: DEAD/DEAH box helicase [Deltaproteobacteria bacterium]|nr:DEAD/DEAH box helicase [Deltaproteobacteria bacterium]
MKTGRPPYRPGSTKRRRENSAEKQGEISSPFHFRIDSKLRNILREIGTPESTPFTPDPFQVEALDKLKTNDVIVSAPTGSGKTWIAATAMAEVLANGGRAWYASPLKALSNAKFLEFGRQFGSEAVGLLTGDHKVNPEAPIIVGTTEILRNQLYDAMSSGTNIDTQLVVIDEAHYLGDPDRGVVWEEGLIYLPVRVRWLLLSATIDNAKEIADWLTFIRRRKAEPIVASKRPVPLHPIFLFPDGRLVSLSKGRSLAPEIKHFLAQGPKVRHPHKAGQIPFNRILRVLAEADLLPAIFFLKSRADCDLALSKAYGHGEFADPIIMEHRLDRLSALLDKYPFLKGHAHIKYLRGPGVFSGDHRQDRDIHGRGGTADQKCCFRESCREGRVPGPCKGGCL